MKSFSIPNRLADVLARKAKGRADSAARPIRDKLAILDAMRADLAPIKEIRDVTASARPTGTKAYSRSIKR